MKPIFNYIITIHNKEALIERVLESVIKCCHENSFIYPVLDGCSDRSEEIIDTVISKNLKVSITKIKMNDVHEILSINEGLKISNQSVEGYNIILQDDVILKDDKIEEKITQLYNKVGDKLGYLSFRLGANLKKDILVNPNSLLFKDYVESAFGHGFDHAKILVPGQFTFRSIAIKSPVCIPTRIIKEFGLLDEHLAPCFHDDTEYCLRLLKNGYKNGVFAISYESDLDWGETRLHPNPKYAGYINNNMSYIKKRYTEVINRTISSNQESDVFSFSEFVDKEETRKAINQYKLSQKKRKKFETLNLSMSEKIKFYVSRGIFYKPSKFIFNFFTNAANKPND